MNETHYQDPDEIFKDIDLSEDEGAPKYIGEEQSKLKSKRKRFRSTLRNMASGLKFDNFGFNLGNNASNTADNLDLPIVCKNKYFAIDSIDCGKSLEVTHGFKVAICDFKGKDNQLWYWDGKCIRNKFYEIMTDSFDNSTIDFVLELHKIDFEGTGWGMVYLSYKHQGKNQLWKLVQDEIVCNYKDLR